MIDWQPLADMLVYIHAISVRVCLLLQIMLAGEADVTPKADPDRMDSCASHCKNSRIHLHSLVGWAVDTMHAWSRVLYNTV